MSTSENFFRPGWLTSLMSLDAFTELCLAVSQNAKSEALDPRDELHNVMWTFYCRAPSRKTETLLACALLVFGVPGRTWYGAPLWVLDAVCGPWNTHTNTFASGDARKHPRALWDISSAMAPGNYDILLSVAKMMVPFHDTEIFGSWHPLLLDSFPELRIAKARADDVSRAIDFCSLCLAPTSYDLGLFIANLAAVVPPKSTERVWRAIVFYVHRLEVPADLRWFLVVDFNLLSVCSRSPYLMAVLKWALA